MSSADEASRPLPRVAYERWLDDLARAGWPAPSARADHPHTDLVPVGDALGRVTAAPVAARWPSPRAACSAMDGIAVRAADLAAAPRADDGDDAGAGGGALRLAAELFEWIDTGDPMPPGTDTVVVRERLLPQADGSVIVVAPTDVAGGAGPAERRAGPTGRAERGRNVRAAGEDFAAGEILVPAGRRLRPGDLSAVAAGGHGTVTVTRRPVVAIIPTGDEIRPVGAVPRRGDIIDTNSLMLAARCRQLGAEPAVGAIVPDDPDALAAELRRAAGQSDLVLVIAGSSRGRGDHAPAVIAQVGGVAVAGVAIRPGHPALLGHAKHHPGGHRHPAGQAGITPVIGLPGYPLATAVIFELFAVPLLSALTGHAPAGHRVRARLDRDWSARPGVENWVLVTLAPADPGGAPGNEEALPVATPAHRGAGAISLLARADAWWPIPHGRLRFPAGAEIEVCPIPGAD
jgi:putative molybdopterin biosynthesis protein